MYNTGMISTAVQAGGRSSRMGEDKALLDLAGKPLYRHVMERLDGLGDEMFLTSNNSELLELDDVRVVPDADPGAGALNGLLTALVAARGSHVLAAACDMPFVSRELFAYMLKRMDCYDVVVPCPGGCYEPLHAVYARTAVPAVQAALSDGRKRMVSFFKEVRVLLIGDAVLKRFDPDGMVFFNINTPEDLITAERYLGEKR